MNITEFALITKEQLLVKLEEAEEYITELEDRIGSLESDLSHANDEIDYWKEQRYD